MSGTGQANALAQLQGFFNATAISLPSTLYFGLFSSAATSTGGGTELGYSGYARPSLATNTTNFSVTNSTPPQVSNQVVINWAAVPANVTTNQVVQVCLFTTSSGTVPFYYLDIPSAYQKPFSQGDVPSFASGTLTVAIN
jgi:Asp-tRNA(Asn)/Glu-tRNA(Gln) amidotransferase B subunit